MKSTMKKIAFVTGPKISPDQEPGGDDELDIYGDIVGNGSSNLSILYKFPSLQLLAPLGATTPQGRAYSTYPQIISMHQFALMCLTLYIMQIGHGIVCRMLPQ